MTFMDSGCRHILGHQSGAWQSHSATKYSRAQVVAWFDEINPEWQR
jgi:hypothetical protein